MELSEVTKSIGEISALAKASGLKIDTELAAIAAHTKASDARLLDLEQRVLVKGTSLASDGPDRLGLDIGAVVARDVKLAALLKGDTRQINVPLDYPLRTIIKSVLTNAGAGAAGTTSYPTRPEELMGGPRGFMARRLLVLESLPSIPVGGAEITIPRLVSIADTTAEILKETDLKPIADLTFDSETIRFKTIAVIAQVSKQLLADNPMLPQFINQTLLFLVARKLENIVVADVLAAATVFPSTLTKAADMIAAAIVSQEAAGYAPSILLTAPENFLAIFAERTSTGEYVGPGWGAAQPGSLWGIKAVPTNALAAGTALLVDPSAITLLDREQANIQIGQIGDNFQRNVWSILGEIRAGCAILDAQGVSVLTLPAAA